LEPGTFDEEYLRKLMAGDAATEEHFSKYFGALLNIKLRSRLRSFHAMEDVKQETFLRVLQYLRRDGLKQPERLGSFVNSVCNNVLFERYRADKRTVPMPEEGWDFASSEPTPEGGFVATEREGHVRKVLEGLPQKDRELLRAVFLQERDKNEVCREFGVDREYLRVLLHRAKSRLRDGFVKVYGAGVRAITLLLILLETFGTRGAL
jgi:RNA polymerase sigma-70 factor (ECF subfamily)